MDEGFYKKVRGRAREFRRKKLSELEFSNEIEKLFVLQWRYIFKDDTF